MVLEDSCALAHGHDDAELTISIIVSHHMHTPQVKIIRTPSEAAIQLVVHDRGERRGIDLARHKWFVGRKGLTDGVVKPVVVLLTEMETEDYYEPYGENDRTGDGELS